VLLLPGVNALAGVGYRWIARNRHGLPGGSDACALRAGRPGSARVAAPRPSLGWRA